MSTTMTPNELKEIDFSRGHSGGLIGIKGHQKGYCGTPLN